MAVQHRQLLVAAVAASLAGCGSASEHATTALHPTPQPHHGRTQARTAAAATLHSSSRLSSLPAPRSGIAAARFGTSIVVIGGLSSAGLSTSTVFRIDSDGRLHAASPLSGPVHDAASISLSGRLLLFGGGQSEGSDRIIQVLPGPPRLVGTLPQPLSDLDAVMIGGVAYVVGGWNGSATNRRIYAVSPNLKLREAGELPIGVRYPAVATIADRMIVAGGETTTGSATAATWSFDPATRTVVRLPDLPSPTDHAAGAALGGRVYVIGGVRAGAPTDSILSWAPGETRWRRGGRLSAALSDLAAMPFDGGIAVIGGRGTNGQVSTVTLMRA